MSPISTLSRMLDYARHVEGNREDFTTEALAARSGTISKPLLLGLSRTGVYGRRT